MRDNTRSLGLAFIFLGVVGFFYSCAGIWFTNRQLPATVDYQDFIYRLMIGMLCANLPVCVVSIWIGTNLGRLLLERPSVPLRFAYAMLPLGFLEGHIFGVAIALYLIRQLERLAREAEIAPDQRVLE